MSDAIVQLVWNTNVRRSEYEGDTFYSLVDLVAECAESQNEARQYWVQLKKRLKADSAFDMEEAQDQLSHHLRQLKLAEEARQLHSAGYSYQQIADRFKVSKSLIASIVRGESWF